MTVPFVPCPACVSGAYRSDLRQRGLPGQWGNDQGILGCAVARGPSRPRSDPFAEFLVSRGRFGALPRVAVADHLVEAALLRAVRATIVVPGLFALAFKVIGDPQMTLFATFGGFATLIFANFGGSRSPRAGRAPGPGRGGQPGPDHRTPVSGITWLAALVTIPSRVRDLLRRRTAPGRGGGLGQRRSARLRAAGGVGGRGGSTPGPRLARWWLASVVGHGRGAAAVAGRARVTGCGPAPPRARSP